MVFSRVGAEWPFYSYKISTLTQTSKELDCTLRIEFLSLTSDFDGASEVGGLFLHPDLRTGGLGRLLARARYLFIAQNRARFGDRVIAELRGVMDADGNSPFWDALGKHFFDLPYAEAERLCGLQSRTFLAELMPQYPIYVPMLPQAAQDCIGRIHPDGQEAFDILEREGFETNSYIDLFDAGPTLYARTANIRSIARSQTASVREQAQIDARGHYLLSNDALHGFRAIVAQLDYQPDQPLSLTPALCAALKVSDGSTVRLTAL